MIVATPGGSDEHNAIASKLAMLLGVRLQGACRYYTPDQRFWIAAHARSRYADGSLASLKAYVLLAQDRRSVTVHRRDDRGAWPGEPERYHGAQSFTLPALSGPVSVDDVYDGILDADGRSLLR